MTHVKNYYEVMIMFVENDNGEFSDPFRAAVGVKQGGNALYLTILLIKCWTI